MPEWTNILLDGNITQHFLSGSLDWWNVFKENCWMKINTKYSTWENFFLHIFMVLRCYLSQGYRNQFWGQWKEILNQSMQKNHDHHGNWNIILTQVDTSIHKRRHMGGVGSQRGVVLAQWGAQGSQNWSGAQECETPSYPSSCLKPELEQVEFLNPKVFCVL